MATDISTITQTATTQPVAQIDVALQAILQSTGQLSNPTLDLNRTLYGNGLIKPVALQASQIDLPGVKSTTDFGKLDLNSAQADYLKSASENISSSTNQNLLSLQNQFTNKILPAITSATQDRAVMQGQLLGQLGAPAETSTRNLSAIQDAQATGQQQILSSYQDFASQISTALNQSQANQVTLYGKAVDLEQQNKQFQFQQDQFLTNAMGTLYSKGVDTQAQTIGGKQANLNLDLGKAQLDSAKFQNSILMNEDGTATEAGQAYKDSIKNQYKLNDVQAQEFLKLYQDAVNSATAESELFKQVQAGNPGAIAKINQEAQIYGDGYRVYWKQGITLDSKGKPSRTLLYDDAALSQNGLFLNTDFNKEGYISLAKNMKEGDRPDVKFSTQIVNAIKNGSTPEALNKIGVQSNDGNVTMLALKNTNKEGVVGYQFKLIDMTGMTDVQKNQLSTAVLGVNPKSPNVLNDLQKVLNDNKAKLNFKDNTITGAEFMNNLVNDGYKSNGAFQGGLQPSSPTSVSFSKVANNRISSSLPPVAQMLAGVLGGITQNGFTALQKSTLMDANYTFSSLQVAAPDTSKALNLITGSYGIGSLNSDSNLQGNVKKALLGNSGLAESDLVQTIGQVKDSGLFDVKDGKYFLNKEISDALRGMKTVRGTMQNELKNDQYVDSMFPAFIMGMYQKTFNGLDMNAANALSNLIKML